MWEHFSVGRAIDLKPILMSSPKMVRWRQMLTTKSHDEDSTLLNEHKGMGIWKVSADEADDQGKTRRTFDQLELHTEPSIQNPLKKEITSSRSLSDAPKIRPRKKRRNSLPAPVHASGMHGQRSDPRHKRGSVTRSFEKIRVKGPVISEEARSKLIVRKQYNPHNTLSNLWLGSAVILVFRHFRPWALTGIHTILLFLWIRVGCKDGSSQCDHSIRDSVQPFEMGLSELSPVFTMCLFVLTFYCNTCINIYRELYFTLTTISTQLKDMSMFLNVFEADSGMRWAIIR
jgi:hypothetical protein